MCDVILRPQHWRCSGCVCAFYLLRYGAKIRAPHALVMTFLFRSGRWEFQLVLLSNLLARHSSAFWRLNSFFSSLHSLKDKLRAILKATYTHSRNLACFVFTYKGLQALQQRMQGKSLQSHSFLAACVGGWLVFGDNNNINSQVRSACGPKNSLSVYWSFITHHGAKTAVAQGNEFGLF